MSLKFTHSAVLVLLLLLLRSFTAISAHEYEDPTIKTMEDFSGYSIHESHSTSLTTLSSLSVDTQSLQKQIDELSTISETPAPSVTRVLYTVKDVLARGEGYNSDISAVATGSHIDAIPYSGKLGFKPKRSLEVILFTSEEPTRFRISYLGSRLMAGIEELANALKTTVDGQNISFLDAAGSAGYTKHKDDLSSVFLKKGCYSGFVELHIEHPILEEEGVSIGIVTAVAAPASIKVEFEGNGGHAGAVLMPNRNDAGLASAELALAVERHVLESGSVDTVGTGGILELHPGAIYSIPSKSHLEIGDIDEERRNIVIEKIHQSAIGMASKRAVSPSEFKIINQDPPALSDKSILKVVEASSKELNLTHKFMISRAYHDSLFMARVSPMGIIFIPCYRGYSHKPEEYASVQDISNGVKVLALTLAKLSLR